MRVNVVLREDLFQKTSTSTFADDVDTDDLSIAAEIIRERYSGDFVEVVSVERTET